ncbi:hypothetical protein BpHYR1_020034 [Brachionus plicatilis]|uniref:Uncharacterized protein n=1 Tax=Brachionus plicatilis TaxID=10195 RepID=A0A3M7RQ82_BRAPC|nr:hypothetical protein BpHYR1_020034 [Brachionus plicatilis]
MFKKIVAMTKITARSDFFGLMSASPRRFFFFSVPTANNYQRPTTTNDQQLLCFSKKFKD